MLFVDNDNDRQPVLFLCPAGDLVERGILLRVANHNVLLLVDALPVHKQYLTGLYGALALIQVVIHYGLQQMRLREVVLHLEVALLVQLVGRYPDEGHLLIGAVASALQLFGQVGQHLRGHYRLACSRGRLEDDGFSIS